MTLISVIIPTKNEEENIGRCLTSLQPSATNNQLTIETIVVDNYSTDKTIVIAKKLGAKVYQIGPERSQQRNYGARKARGKYLFFIDADMTIGKKVISQAAKLLGKNPEIKAVIIPEVTVGKNYWAKVRSLERSCYLNNPLIEAARIFEIKAFFKIGGYDEKLIAAEDWDLTNRIKKLGTTDRVKAFITHHEDQFSLVDHLKKKYYYGQNVNGYARKHPQAFKQQSGWSRISLFLKNWPKLAIDPIHALGVMILKSLEYLTFLFAKITA